MAKNELRITIHMVSSLDGMIARRDNNVSWFETSHYFEKGVPAPDPEAILMSIDCYVMGSRTYELALALSHEYGWAYGDKPTIVLTNRDLPNDKPNIEFFAGDLHQLIDERLRPHFHNVWVVGGSMVTREFIRQKLANEIRVSILPILLGDGLLFFDQIGQEQVLHLTDARAYTSGMVELCYQCVR